MDRRSPERARVRRRNKFPLRMAGGIATATALLATGGGGVYVSNTNHHVRRQAYTAALELARQRSRCDIVRFSSKWSGNQTSLGITVRLTAGAPVSTLLNKQYDGPGRDINFRDATGAEGAALIIERTGARRAIGEVPLDSVEGIYTLQLSLTAGRYSLQVAKRNAIAVESSGPLIGDETEVVESEAHCGSLDVHVI